MTRHDHCPFDRSRWLAGCDGLDRQEAGTGLINLRGGSARETSALLRAR